MLLLGLSWLNPSKRQGSKPWLLTQGQQLWHAPGRYEGLVETLRPGAKLALAPWKVLWELVFGDIMLL